MSSTLLVLTQARASFGRLPAAVILMAAAVTFLVLIPPVYLVIRASSEGSRIFEMLTEPNTIAALRRTLVLTVTVTASCIALAAPLAWLTERTDLPFRGVVAVLLALPLAVPTFVGGYIVISALGPGGMLQDLLEPLGVQQLPPIYGFWGAWATLTVVSYPYVFLTVRSAIGRIDPALEEAARSLGKNVRWTFLRVSLPQLRPAISAGAILVALYVLSEFGAVVMLRYDTLTPLVYLNYTTRFDRSAAAVMALPLIFIAVLIVAIDAVTRGRARYHATGQKRPAKIQRLGAWRWPLLAFCGAIIGLGVAMPLLVILYWLVRGLNEGQSAGFVLTAVTNSAQASALAALFAVAAALPVAILSARHPGWASGLFEKATFSGQALPGIAMALALVFFTSRYLTPVYQTLALLIFAYMVRFLPEAVGSCRTAMLQVNPNTEEAAKSLGAGGLRVFARITAPQIVPGMTAGALLVFLTCMKELPITLLLSPIGYDTLASDIWSASREAFFTRAAIPALLLVGLSGLAVVLMLRRDRMRT